MSADRQSLGTPATYSSHIPFNWGSFQNHLLDYLFKKFKCKQQKQCALTDKSTLNKHHSAAVPNKQTAALNDSEWQIFGFMI